MSNFLNQNASHNSASSPKAVVFLYGWMGCQEKHLQKIVVIQTSKQSDL